MTSLKKLKITPTYYSVEDELKYNIPVPPSFQSPKQRAKHHIAIIDAVSKDAEKKGGLEKLSLSVGSEDQKKTLESTAGDLTELSRTHESIAHKGPILSKVAVNGGAILGGLAGMILSYNQMSEWATDVANYMNSASHLWAPITGVVQSGISAFGTVVSTAVGAVAGLSVGGAIQTPYLNHKAPLRGNVKRYKGFLKASKTSEIYDASQDSTEGD